MLLQVCICVMTFTVTLTFQRQSKQFSVKFCNSTNSNSSNKTMHLFVVCYLIIGAAFYVQGSMVVQDILKKCMTNGRRGFKILVDPDDPETNAFANLLTNYTCPFHHGYKLASS